MVGYKLYVSKVITYTVCSRVRYRPTALSVCTVAVAKKGVGLHFL